MQKPVVYALHGFLGCSQDWKEFAKNLPNVDFYGEDLFLKEKTPYAQLKKVKNIKNQKKIFVGYSLGGRLGLSILKDEPELFDHYFFVSTHNGFKDDDLESRKLRSLSDQSWLAKLNEENWDNFISEWNLQPVFSGSKKKDFLYQKEKLNFTELAKGLTIWSLAEQPDYSEIIKKHKHKITWVIGSRDTKFLSLAQELLKNKIILNLKVIESSHRVHIDKPEELAKVVNLALLKTE